MGRWRIYVQRSIIKSHKSCSDQMEFGGAARGVAKNKKMRARDVCVSFMFSARALERYMMMMMVMVCSVGLEHYIYKNQPNK